MRGQRVLLTGGAGFLGANLTRELLRQGADVHVLPGDHDEIVTRHIDRVAELLRPYL